MYFGLGPHLPFLFKVIRSNMTHENSLKGSPFVDYTYTLREPSLAAHILHIDAVFLSACQQPPTTAYTGQLVHSPVSELAYQSSPEGGPVQSLTSQPNESRSLLQNYHRGIVLWGDYRHDQPTAFFHPGTGSRRR